MTYHKELEALAESFKLKVATAKNIVSAQAIPEDIEILFLLSVPAQLKSSLLQAAELLVYPPSSEHFGIVPLEAMLAGVPVLAANSGGPLETVLDPETGWLRPVDKLEQWTDVMHQVLHEMPERTRQQIGEHGKRHVRAEFSETKMAHRLDEEIKAMIEAPRQQATELGDVGLAFFIYTMAIGAIAFVLREATRTDIPVAAIEMTDILVALALVGIAIFVSGAVTWKLLQNESAFT